MSGMKISFSKAEAAHIMRDLTAVSGDHGKRNVSRETHDMIMGKLQAYLEVAFRGSNTTHDQQPLFPLPPDGVGTTEHQ